MGDSQKRQIVNSVLVLCSDFMEKKMNNTTFHTNYITLVKKVQNSKSRRDIYNEFGVGGH